MIKKITALLLALILAGGGSALAYNDTAADLQLDRAVNMLSSLNIISGMGDGGYHPYEYLTRAQFAKIAVYLMGREESAVSTAVPFTDVPAGHWAMGYIGLVSADGIIAGYPNGTFGADEQITCAQAVTVVVRTLGFGGEDVGYRWPDGYLEKAQAIGLLDGVNVGDLNAPITRGEAAKLCYNALFCDMKTGGELISMRKVTRAEDVVVIADAETDVSLPTGTISTSAGNFRVTADSNVPADMVGTKGDLYYDSDGDVIVYTPDPETVRTLIVTSTLMNADANRVEIYYTENGKAGSESLALNHPIYNEGAAMTVGTGYKLMTEGSELKLYYDDRGSLQRGLLSTHTMLGPVTVEGDGFSAADSFGITDLSSLRVIRKGLSASLADIRRFDVLYYAANTNTLYAYDDKVTGIYDEALPIKANVTSIVLSGTTYELATQTAINKLNESKGAFAINDRVTLLRGRNGEIVDAVDTDAADTQSYGVIQNAYVQITDNKNNPGRGDYRVTMFMGDGTTADYVCDKDYTDNIGDFCRLKFSDGVLTLEKVSYKKITGSFDKNAPSLGGHWFADDFGIIELVSLPEEGPATLRKVSLNEISASSLSASEVIHAQTTGDMGDISVLYVRGLTNEQYTYGVVTERETADGYDSNDATKTFTLLLGSTETKITNNYAFKPGDAIGYGPGEDGANRFIDLLKVAGGNAVTARTSGRIRVDDKIYSVSDSAVAYGGTSPAYYRALSLDELTDMQNVRSVSLYSDRSLAEGGDIKVIVVQTY